MTFLPETKENKFLKIYKDEKEYRADKEAWNYSKLSDFIKSPLLVWRKKHILGEDDFKVTDDMNFGSLVDCMLFEPHLVDEKFGISSAPTPTDGPLKFVNELIELVRESKSGGVEGHMLQTAYTNAGIKSPKFEGFITDRFYGTDVESYFAEKLENIGKVTMDFKEFERATRVVKMLKESPQTKSILEAEGFSQYPIKALIEGELVRILLDRVVIDHKNKVVAPYDLKCITTDIDDFIYSFFKFKYYLQKGLYEEVTKVWSSEVYPGYTVEPFKFIVADASGFMQPLIYEIEPPQGQDFLHTFKVGERTYLAGMDIIKTIKYHIENDEWTTTLKNKENKGYVKVVLN